MVYGTHGPLGPRRKYWSPTTLGALTRRPTGPIVRFTTRRMVARDRSAPDLDQPRRRFCADELAGAAPRRLRRAGRGQVLRDGQHRAWDRLPGTGTTATTYRFTVTVSDKSGTAPAWVRVRVNGTTSDLSAGGTNFKAGVDFSGTRTLPAGTWPYSFVVGIGGGTTCSFSGVDPATVVVTAPADPKPLRSPRRNRRRSRPPSRHRDHAETDSQADPEARQGHAQADSQATIDRLAETHRPTHAGTATASPVPPSEPVATPKPTPTASPTPRLPARWYDRLRTRWRGFRRPELRRERHRRRVHQPVGRLAHDDGRRRVVLPVPRAPAVRRGRLVVRWPRACSRAEQPRACCSSIGSYASARGRPHAERDRHAGGSQGAPGVRHATDEGGRAGEDRLSPRQGELQA